MFASLTMSRSAARRMKSSNVARANFGELTSAAFHNPVAALASHVALYIYDML